jgi:hypothetical protein
MIFSMHRIDLWLSVLPTPAAWRPTASYHLAAVGILSLVMLVALGGCAAQSASALPWWVASPSAPLPKGFPQPGPPGQVIVKDYPDYRAAVTRSGDDAKGGTNSLFFPLFDHIQKNQIAMSAPVEMTYASSQEHESKDSSPRSMAFIYGDPSAGKLGTDGPVQVMEVPAMTVASIGVTGTYTEEHFREAQGQLQAWLKDHASQYVVAGNPRYLAYNSPFVLPFMRYGEVQVPIRQLSN